MSEGNRPFPVGARVEYKDPPPHAGVVVGYLSDRHGTSPGELVVRRDGEDTVVFLPAGFWKLEGS